MNFIMVSIVAGKATTFSLIPIVDNYDVYELRDEKTSETFIIAHSKSSKKLPNKKMVVAGVLKELKKDEKGTKDKFLEVIYHL